jgi:hypothetical protein
MDTRHRILLTTDRTMSNTGPLKSCLTEIPLTNQNLWNSVETREFSRGSQEKPKRFQEDLAQQAVRCPNGFPFLSQPFRNSSSDRRATLYLSLQWLIFLGSFRCWIKRMSAKWRTLYPRGAVGPARTGQKLKSDHVRWIVPRSLVLAQEQEPPAAPVVLGSRFLTASAALSPFFLSFLID